MNIDIVTREEVLAMLEIFTDNGLMRRETAANYLDMPLSTFDAFVRDNPHLKRYNGKRIRYCPKDLKNAFQSAF
ncbi:hypothetical protein D2V93_08460 [Flagellimonas taeanensis]|uniref:hypothetical protein n=1 Tax=Flagellimonas taeanensis TaxID=1005926 RepID=UPI000E692BE0|nr:hypothetical protein [Allomuricauda taeanensis]RIV50893.1 hypothetical protein D2V93_08460 [Allomuricauda taeanensis]